MKSQYLNSLIGIAFFMASGFVRAENMPIHVTASGIQTVAEKPAQSDPHKTVAPKSTVIFMYEQLPPYTYIVNGQVTGIYVEAIKERFAGSAIRPVWRQSNFTRMKQEIQRQEANFCIAGYDFRGVKYSGLKHSTLFLKIAPHVVVFAAEQGHRFAEIGSFKELYNDPNFTGAFIAGGSYAKFVTAQSIRDHGHIAIAGADIDLLKLIDFGRVDYTIMDSNQIDFVNDQAIFQTKFAYEPLDLTNDGAILNRSVTCGVKVADQVIDLLSRP